MSTRPPKRHHAAPVAGAYAITVHPDPLTTGPESGTATVTTDQYGWLHVHTPCVDGWTNIAPGTSDVAFYRGTGCDGGYTFTITDAGDANGAVTELYSVTVASQ